MESAIRGLVAFVLLVTCLGARANDGSVRLNVFPTVALADGRSPVTVTAEVRSGSGAIVPDGTQVVFSSSLGSFRESVVTTTNGIARATLVASPVAGAARITASVLAYNASGVAEAEFVADRSLLSSALEYVEVVAADYLVYSTETRILGAASPDQGATLRYREIEITADDLQLNVPAYELRARNATLRIGRNPPRQFRQLYLKLNQRSGYGVTMVEVPAPAPSEDETPSPPAPVRERLMLVKMGRTGIEPATSPPGEQTFQFADLSDAMTFVSARKVLVYPAREIQFHRADVLVGGAKVMSMPLFQISTATAAPLGADQFVNITNNQLAIDYPYYLSLRPGETTLLRLRSGSRYSSGIGAASGTFLDYEMRWNRGDAMEGGLTVAGIGRSDWGVGVRQYLRLGDRTSATGQVDLPANRSVLASAGMSHQFDGLQANFNANFSRNLRGARLQTEQYYLVLEKDPMKLGALPMRLFYGLSASQSHIATRSFSSYDQSYGLRTRLQVDPMALGSGASLNVGATASRLFGSRARRGFALGATAALSTVLGRGGSGVFTYEFQDDGFSSALVGKHRVSAQTYFALGRTSISFYGGRSLDSDRLNLLGTASWRMSDLWRFSYAYSLDRFAGTDFTDAALVLGYRVGGREVGLSYSSRTRRIGIEFLGARFD
jgi:hypothetical protein